MNEIRTFVNEKFGSVRVLEKNNEPWFVAADVCRALGVGNPSQALTRLDEDEKLTTLISNEGAATGMSSLSFVSEPGLYSLILGSRKPEAKLFKRWITHDVIPTIRKTGGYVANDDLFIETYLPNADESTKIMFKSQLQVIQDLNHKIALNAPKVAFAEKVSASEAAITVAQMATLLKQNGVKTGQNRFYAWLRENGYCVATGARRNAPTQKSLELGILEAQEVVFKAGDKDALKLSSRVTPKGQHYFLKKFTEQKQAS